MAGRTEVLSNAGPHLDVRDSRRAKPRTDWTLRIVSGGHPMAAAEVNVSFALVGSGSVYATPP
jgi:hypothetical protein